VSELQVRLDEYLTARDDRASAEARELRASEQLANYLNSVGVFARREDQELEVLVNGYLIAVRYSVSAHGRIRRVRRPIAEADLPLEQAL